MGCAMAAGQTLESAPVKPLPDKQSVQRYERGRALLEQIWQIAPGKDKQHDGLGPLFNAASCQGCHSTATRRQVPEIDRDRLISALVRVSVQDGKETRPHP